VSAKYEMIQEIAQEKEDNYLAVIGNCLAKGIQYVSDNGADSVWQQISQIDNYLAGIAGGKAAMNKILSESIDNSYIAFLDTIEILKEGSR
jgi:hypothetical protein